MGRKIVLIGAGSAMFTRGLVADMIQSPDLGPWELGLVDINLEALKTAEGLSKRMVQAKEAEISVKASIERADILPDADVVVTTIGVGGRRAWEADVFIPRKYGIYQPVGDSVMAGGVSRSMRMIPALVDIAMDILQYCPDAMFFNYSNPMTTNCWAIWKATGVPVTGLCHGTFFVERYLADLIDVPPEEVTTLFVGLNHLTFIHDFRWKGKDAWPLVRAKLAEKPDEVARNPFSWSLFETYGTFPAVFDRHVVEFFPERFADGKYNGKTLGVDTFSVEETIAGGDRIYENMKAQALGEQPLNESVFDRSEGEHEQLLDILRSIDNDQRKIFAANLPNWGAVPNIPAEAILEIPAVATATGLKPIQIIDFPDTIAAVLSRKISAASLTVSAALSGDRDLFVEALLADGSVSDPDTARKMSEELLEAHKEYLPNFWE